MYKRSQDEKNIAKLFKNASVIEQFSDIGNIFYKKIEYRGMTFTERVFLCKLCGEKCYDSYMLKDRVWKALNLKSKDLVCLSCLKLYFKKLLNRNLQLSDFKDVPANKLLFVICWL
jgi:hypothetical protein